MSAAAFVGWQLYTVMRLQMESAALRRAVVAYKFDGSLSLWSDFAMSYGSLAWVIPLLSLALVAAQRFRGWGDTGRMGVLGVVAGLAVTMHILLTEGVYEPVMWFMNKVL